MYARAVAQPLVVARHSEYKRHTDAAYDAASVVILAEGCYD